MKKKKATYVTHKNAIDFAKLNRNASPVSWAIRLAIIKRFAEYWIHVDPRTEIPTQILGSSTYQRKAPYIFSDDEVRRILECCMASNSINEIDRYSYFMWYGLMIVTGIRTGEAERLDRKDVNLSDGILTIHNSKFNKSRQLPLHSTTVNALYDYINYLDRYVPTPKTSKLFINHSGNAISAEIARKIFRCILAEAGIQRTPEGRPRILDFRHSFATNTLVRWYSHHVNIDQKLLLLSTYLGHVHFRHTYWYITITPKLLKLIVSRIEKTRRGI
jgi:integrase